MPFLKRSKSQKVKEVKEMDRKPEPLPEQKPHRVLEHTAEPILEQGDSGKEKRKSRYERRASIFARSKSADARKSVDMRPRTAQKSTERKQDLEMLGARMDIQEGGDTFSFPTPSPRLPPPRSATLQAAPSPLSGPESPFATIGVALGSPRHAPPNWGRSMTMADVPNPADPRPAPARAHTTIPEHMEDSAARPELRKKKSGWKTFGNLFQRKPSKLAPPEPFYKVQMEPAAAPVPQARPLIDTPTPSPGPLRSPGSISSHHSRTPSITRGLARFEARAEADRASLMPNIESKIMRTPSMIQRESIMPVSKPLPSIRDSEDLFRLVQDDRQDSPMSATSARYPGAVPRTPRLDLDIPKGDMERYSVMFEKLLEPRQSILERRQSKAKRVKSIRREATAVPRVQTPKVAAVPVLDTKEAGSLQRSLTSPQLNKVPSLQITVAGKDGGRSAEAPVTAVHRPRPIRRSKTAPPGSVSPVAPNFSRPKAPTFAGSDSEVSPSSPLYGENSLPPTPTTITDFADNDSVALMSHGGKKIPLVPRVDADEPSWDMLTSKPADLSPDGVRPELYPRVKSPEELERQIVQVSVARQVSVNKARRQVQKAVESKQPLRPRVVELSKNRKSTVVLIEGGDD